MASNSDPWWQVVVDVPADEVETLEAWLLDAGAVSITLRDPSERDATGGARLDGAVVEPLPGDMPLWRDVRLVGLFDRAAAPTDIRTVLDNTAPRDAPAYRLEPLSDAPWERAWMDGFGAMRFGRSLWVCPTHVDPPEPTATVVRLDPGLAFGTGTHPTTALCLEWLGDHAESLAGIDVIDYGCGSGILAVAAAKLGAGQVHATDIDPQALVATAENARLNGVAERLRIAATEPPPAPAALLLANILYNPLMELADHLSQLVRPGGRLILAGMLDHQSEPLMARYADRFTFEPTISRDGWTRLSARRVAD